MQAVYEELIRSIIADRGHLSVPVEHLSNDDDLYAAGFTADAGANVLRDLERAIELEIPDSLLAPGPTLSIADISDAVETLHA